MSELEGYFRANQGRLISKWRHYFEIYERHFAPYRGRPVRILEYGVSHGGSLRMWRWYFGEAAQIVGVDVNPECSRFAEPGIDIVIGDQADPALHRGLRERYGTFDIVIDDGGHHMAQQLTTFREMYPAVALGGVYFAEDLHSSYFPNWGGGLGQPGTFIEMAKQLVDQLHAWWGPIPGLPPDLVTQTAFAVHFYDSILVIEKRRRGPAEAVYSGEPTLEQSPGELDFLARIDEREGRIAQALEKMRRVLASAPDNAQVAERVQRLEARLA